MLPYLLLVILIAGSVSLIAIAIFSPPKVYMRLEGVPKKGGKLSAASFRTILAPVGAALQPLVGKLTYLAKLKENADILRLPVDLPLLVALKLFLGLLLAFVTTILFAKESFLYIPVAFLVGFFLPDFMITRKIAGKKEEIISCFPETVDLLHMCINAGADLISAIRWLLEKSTPNPFIEQLAIVLSEVQVGKPRAEALRDMAKRLKLADISSFSRVIVQAERMGTPVEEAFKNLSEDTRNRRYQIGERFAIKASLKILFPLIFCILPSIMIIVAGPIIIKFSQGDMLPGF